MGFYPKAMGSSDQLQRCKLVCLSRFAIQDLSCPKSASVTEHIPLKGLAVLPVFLIVDSLDAQREKCKLDFINAHLTDIACLTPTPSPITTSGMAS
ncbi:hypothetical protein SKAU_G00126200 [Synaphobranchus kaupii]|uniref:Uncharacterized protein n=1 Tax=Synaphobranchus kaupii TaxID=118154 RepID=A0A9Q1FPQ9_SYNKA|nr:hypothetical protein SKAU_G00126200 [Synaphobranchus kaupii]